MTKKVVLHLISSNGFFGAENVVFQIAKESFPFGIKPFVGVFKNSYEPHIELAEKVQAKSIEIKVFGCRGKFDFKTISQIRQLVKDNSIDVVHSHGYKSNFYGFLASLGLNIKRIATCHNWLGKSKKMKFYEKLDKLLLSKFDKVVVVSDALKKDVLRSGIFEEKVVVIDNGIDIDKFKVISDKLQVKKTLGIREEGYVVGTVGRLTEEKGHIYLIEAFRKVITKFSNAKLLIVGDGPLREDLELAVSSMKLKEKVVFAGMREDIPEMLNIMDMFVLPSLTEGMPMALLEAMASQTPIIATKVGAIPKIIDNGHSGLLIDPNDVIQLSRAIVNLLKSKEKAQSLSQNAYNLVKKRFSSERMAGEYAKVYESLFM